jgi:hypothetical protein
MNRIIAVICGRGILPSLEQKLTKATKDNCFFQSSFPSRPSVQAFSVLLLVGLLFCRLCVHAQQADASSSYDQLVGTASSLLKQGKLDEAKQAAQRAIEQNANGYQAYAVAAKIASQQGAAADAANFIKKALELAPDDATKAKVKQLAAMLATTGSPNQPTPGQSSLSGQDQRKLDVLMLILEDAEKATTPEDRAKAFREYLEKSGDFAAAHPEQTNIWVMRAFAAVDLDEPKLGWEAGKKLQALGADNSNDPKLRRAMASLDRKGWLGDKPAADRREINAAIKSVIDSINERLQDCPIGIWKQGNVSLVVAGQYKLFPSDGKLEFRVEMHRPGDAPSTQILSVALSDLTPDSVQFAEKLPALKEIVKNLQAFNAIVIGKGNQASKVTSAKVRSGQTLEVETGEFVVVLPANAARAPLTSLRRRWNWPRMMPPKPRCSSWPPCSPR